MKEQNERLSNENDQIKNNYLNKNKGEGDEEDEDYDGENNMNGEGGQEQEGQQEDQENNQEEHKGIYLLKNFKYFGFFN